MPASSPGREFPRTERPEDPANSAGVFSDSQRLKVVTIYGARSLEELPGLHRIRDRAVIRFASDQRQLREALQGSEILFIWTCRSGPLSEVWAAADQLRWLHWSNVGVDSLLFPKLVQSDVVVTNARGVYDEAIAEYVLGLIFLFAKRCTFFISSMSMVIGLTRPVRGEWTLWTRRPRRLSEAFLWGPPKMRDWRLPQREAHSPATRTRAGPNGSRCCAVFWRRSRPMSRRSPKPYPMKWVRPLPWR